MNPDFVLDIFKNSEPFQNIVGRAKENEEISVSGLPGSSRAYFVRALIDAGLSDVLVVTPDEDSARQFFQDLDCISGSENIYMYPAYDRTAWSEIGPPTALVGEKLQVLKRLSNKGQNVIITYPEALVEKLAAKDRLSDYRLKIHVEQERSFEDFVAFLVKAGYVREERVDRPGEMSVRGGIVDIFLYESMNPVRIEFFGDEIESIREFDVISQRSINQLTEVEILAPGLAGFFGAFEDHPMEATFFEKSVLDHLAAETMLVLVDEELFDKSAEEYNKKICERISSFSAEHHFKNLAYEDYYCSYQSLKSKMSQFQKIRIGGITADFESINMGIVAGSSYGGNLKVFRKEVSEFIKIAKNPRIVLCADSEAQKNRLEKIITEEKFPEPLSVVTFNIYSGFVWPDQELAVFTGRELYGRQRSQIGKELGKRAVSLKEFISLNFGDYVVHTDYGIGIYRGLKKIKAYGKERECLKIEYMDGDILYVPLEKMDLVQKYSAKDGTIPQLTKLGTNAWEKLKKRTKENAIEIAKKLIKLYAVRKMRKGFAFSKDSIWQNELEATFYFEETPDQLTAIQDVKRDMENSQPMDRLVCGDVGFGKTEVAVRAAFKAIDNGKQVAVLVPTTILAYQHFTTFKDRLSQFPVRIDMLSRFKSKPQQTEIIEKLARGEIDLIVGTHRLLSKDVKFKDLGLLVVDEEQKFGVLHKERLRLLRENVDTLSLSATPIPRTMHMSMVGAKDLSLINSPPSDRIPIKTEVCRFDRDLLREVILKEIDRGGQVFFVHNRVQSIYGIAALLRELVPEVTFAVAHGQMKSTELERVMLSFSRGEVQCLISTMIIESGIDMPRANTLIVNRADRLGLSQLYQLRGRVGRSNQQAYAYLIIPPLKNLTRTAIKRLQTIQELTHFGSGYKVAMRDLEIRGAGNIFGAKQSGFIDALGYELYTKIIEQAIAEMKQELKIDQVEEKPKEIETAVTMDKDYYLPSDYISLSAERVELYKRLIEIKDLKEHEDLRNEVVDRFGPLPEPAKNLFDYIALKKTAQRARLSQLSIEEGTLNGRFAEEHIPKGEQFKPWLGGLVKAGGKSLELKQKGNELHFSFKIHPNDNVIEQSINFLQRIA